MDGGVSSAAIEVLLQNLMDVFKQEYSLIRDLEEEVEQLHKTLRVIQAYLNDAEKKSISEQSVKLWLRELEAMTFEADNVLDEFSYHLLRKSVNKMKSPKKKVRSCFSPFKRITSRRNMALKIKDINKNFECMSTRAFDLGLQSMIVNASAPVYASVETDSLTLDPIFIGRDDDVEKLVGVATETERSQENKFSILAIVGMGGLGKTTLTRKVFNHQKMVARFGRSRIWVHVSQTFDPIILLKKILSAVTSQTSEAAGSREVVLKKLREALEDKTYLLVLDDVWNQDVPKWEEFMNSIGGATSTMGNAIIMSTRNGDVASLVKPLHIHPLKGLSDEECWSIIKDKAFESGQVPPSGFEMIGREIAKRCKGLPLAANVVGGLLHGCKTLEEWRLVNGNRLLDVEGGENVFKILRLSYDYLASPSLKKCFAYCSFFPKGCVMINQLLIEMWMAEGFLQAGGRNEESMESVGNKFIKVLLHNSLLLVSERDEYGNVTSCTMHDLVHDLASSVLGSSDTTDGNTPLRYAMIDVSNPISKEVAKHVRTLGLEGDNSGGTMFTDFESLHVLIIQDWEARQLPNSIRKLIHLRNLYISDTSIEELPEWIGELYHLQTLRAPVNLEKLPGTLVYLINLRHLYISWGVELLANIGRLTSLQTLTHFNVGDKKGYRIEELGSLKNLKGKLQIHGLERVHGKEEALKANIYHKPNLLELGFKWRLYRGTGATDDDESVLEGLQPHPNLKKLMINGYKGKMFPSWVQKMAVRDETQQGSSWVPLTNLIEIKVTECWECEEIPMLAHLPNLKSLELRGLKNVRITNSSFNKLTKLRLVSLEGSECLPEWLFYNNPNLSHLEIKECPNLSELPDGLHTLTSLEELTIYNCPNLKSIGKNNTPDGGSGGRRGLFRQLLIDECGELVELPRQMMESWAPSLVNLFLSKLSGLQNLPEVIDCLAKSATHLKRLVIVGVPRFMAGSSSVESWSCGSLGDIKIDVSVEWSMESSGSIKEAVEGMLLGCRNSLYALNLKGVTDWDWLPASIQYLASVRGLELESLGIQELPQWFENLSSLRYLYLRSCNELRRLPPGDACKALTRLQTLAIQDCPKLEVDPEWRNIPHLQIKVDGHPIEN